MLISPRYFLKSCFILSTNRLTKISILATVHPLRISIFFPVCVMSVCVKFTCMGKHDALKVKVRFNPCTNVSTAISFLPSLCYIWVRPISNGNLRHKWLNPSNVTHTHMQSIQNHACICACKIIKFISGSAWPAFLTHNLGNTFWLL